MLLPTATDFPVLVLDCVSVDNCVESCKESTDSSWYLLSDDSDTELSVSFFLDDPANNIYIVKFIVGK